MKRTLEQYKKDVWDKWSDNRKLEYIYDVSKQLCELEEKIKKKEKKEWKKIMGRRYE